MRKPSWDWSSFLVCSVCGQYCGISNETASTLVMCRTPMIDREKGKCEKVILSLLRSLKDPNTAIPLPRKLDAASPCPELFRSCLYCRPSLNKMPMNQLPFVLAVPNPTSDIPDALFALWQQRKVMVPSPPKCLSLALLMWRRWRSWNTAVSSWKGLSWMVGMGTESWTKGAQEQEQSLRRATWAPAEDLAAISLHVTAVKTHLCGGGHTLCLHDHKHLRDAFSPQKCQTSLPEGCLAWSHSPVVLRWVIRL